MDSVQNGVYLVYFIAINGPVITFLISQEFNKVNSPVVSYLADWFHEIPSYKL